MALTVIAWKDGMLAVDSQSFIFDLAAGTVAKEWQHPFEPIVAMAAGPAASIRAIYDVLEKAAQAGASIHEALDLVEIKEGQYQVGMRVMTATESIEVSPAGWYAEDAETAFGATGSHDEFLYGTLVAGASPFEAVKHAISLRGWANWPIRVFWAGVEQFEVHHENGEMETLPTRHHEDAFIRAARAATKQKGRKPCKTQSKARRPNRQTKVKKSSALHPQTLAARAPKTQAKKRSSKK